MQEGMVGNKGTKSGETKPEVLENGTTLAECVDLENTSPRSVVCLTQPGVLHIYVHMY